MEPEIYKRLYEGYFRLQMTGPKAWKAPDTKDFTNILSYERVYQEAGVSGKLKKEITLVDTDTEADTNALRRVLEANHLVVPEEKTTHGYHFYFQHDPAVCDNAYTKAITACGIMVDYKLGSKNGLDVLKQKGQWREWRNKDAPLVPLPIFLKPVKTQGKVGEERVSLATLTEGSRNDTLFKFVGTLKRKGFNLEQTQMMLHMINHCVIPEGERLSDEEIKCIARPKAFEEAKTEGELVFDFGGKGRAKVNYVKLAEEVMDGRKWGIANETLFLKDRGVYEPLGETDITRLIMERVDNEELTVRKMNNIRAFMKAKATDLNLTVDMIKNPELILFNNGIYDMESGMFTDDFDTCPHVFFSRVPHDYVEGEQGENKLVQQFLDDVACGDKSIVQLLLELIGACLYRQNVLRGIFILVGDKVNGKSTFIDWLQYLLGESNISSVPFEELGGRFSTSQLVGKLANLSQDISDIHISDASVIKSIATSDTIIAEEKHQKAFKFKPYTTLVCSANFLPTINDPTGAVADRLIPIPFNADFKRNGKRDYFMLKKLCTEEAAQWAIKAGISAFMQALRRGSYTTGAAVQEVLSEYVDSNNPVLMFLKQTFADINRGLDQCSVGELFYKFGEFCKDELCPQMSRRKFVRRVKAVTTNLTTARKVTNSPYTQDGRGREYVFTKVVEGIDITYN